MIDLITQKRNGIVGHYFDLESSLEAFFNRRGDLVIVRHFENPYFRASAEASGEPVYAL